ncbi:MAG: S-adenosyl-l-methionine hydroxide adenosyltransferase family protein [Actinomycetota bacterium]
MPTRFQTVSFLSDLGVVDETVGVVRAVLRDMAPHAIVVDLTHHVLPFDVRAGSLALARAIGYVPSGVVLAAVDARTAGERPAVAIEVAGGEGVLIGPDNGLLAPAVAMAGGADRAVLLTNTELQLQSPGALFLPRDVMAPAAAHLCNGGELTDLGELVDADTLLPGVVPLPRDAADGGVSAEVLWVDHVGNVQLNVGPDDLPWAPPQGSRLSVTVGEAVRVAELVRDASLLGPGSFGLVADPHGMLALVLDRRSAAEELAVATGDQITLSPLAEGGGAGVTSPVVLRRPTDR